MSLLIIVRRERVERFQGLQRELAHEPAEIIWDRRVAERRHRDPLGTLTPRPGERRQRQEETFALGLAEDRRTTAGDTRQELSSLERRRRERRGRPPGSWTALDYLVVRRPDPP